MKVLMKRRLIGLVLLVVGIGLSGGIGLAADAPQQPATEAGPVKTTISIVKTGPATSTVPVVKSSNDKVSVGLYGQVNRAMLYTSDGDSHRFYHVDNEHSSSRIGLNGKAANMIGDMSLGLKLEYEYQVNSSAMVNQKVKTKNDEGFKLRHTDLFVTSERYGKLYLGHGSTASDGTAEVDLSGTTLIGYSSVSDMAGGTFFFDSTTGALSPATTIGSAFDNMDGLSRNNRIRYDSPEFFGVTVSVSNVSGGDNDLAVRYAAKFGGFKLAAAGALADADDSTTTKNGIISASASVLHDTGFSGTVALGKTSYRAPGKDDGNYIYLKGGYQTQFIDIGQSAFGVDLGFYNDINANGDEGTTLGLLAVQHIDPWAMETYFGYRFHKLDRSGPADFDNVNALMLGARVKF